MSAGRKVISLQHRKSRIECRECYKNRISKCSQIYAELQRYDQLPYSVTL